MEIKRDAKGKPIGLQWPEWPDKTKIYYEKPKPKKTYKPTGRPRGGVTMYRQGLYEQ